MGRLERLSLTSGLPGLSSHVSDGGHYTNRTGDGLYIDQILGTFGTSIISFPDLSITSGITCTDLSGNSRPGTCTGVTLNDGLGPVGAKYFTFWDGPNTDYINWYTASLAAAFSGHEGSVMCWAKVQTVGVWSDGSYRRLIELGAGAHYVRISRQGATAGRLYCEHKAVSSALTNIDTGSPTAWFHVAITWSQLANQFIVYYNGIAIGAPAAIGNFTNALVNTTTLIGASTTAPLNSWSGWIAYPVLLNRPALASEVLAVARFFP